MKSVIAPSLIDTGRRWLAAPGNQDSRPDYHPARHLKRSHVLGQDDEREEGAEERLEVGIERRAGGAHPIDRSEPHDVCEHEREEEAVHERTPGERAEMGPGLAAGW